MAYYITSGKTSNGLRVVNNDMYISSGGIANSTNVEYNGCVYILNGGVANNTTVDYGGYICVSSGGVANSTTLGNVGGMFIYQGGVHKGTLRIGHFVSAYSGAKIDFTIAGRKTTDSYLIDNLSLIKGAPTYSITIKPDQSAGTYKLAQNASSFSGSITIGDGSVNYGSIKVNGEDFIYDNKIYSLDITDYRNGGNLTLSIAKALPVLIYSSGTLTSSGTTIMGANIVAGANDKMCILSGGVASKSTVSSGGRMLISSGGTASNTTLLSGAYSNYAYSGATVKDMIISSGARLFISGSDVNATGLVIKEGGFVDADVHAADVNRNISGKHEIYGDFYVRNGSASGFVVSSGDGFFVTRGTAEKTIINGGSMGINATGIGSNTTVNSGGTLKVNGKANSVTVNSGGLVEVSSGGIAASTLISSGGRMLISSGGIASNTTLLSGAYSNFAYSGATVKDMIISSGARLFISGSDVNATGLVIKEGGFVDADVHAADVNRNISGKHEIYGDFYVRNGSASGFVVSSGDGFFVTRGTAEKTIINGGSMGINATGIGSNTTVNSGGTLKVNGKANSVTVNSGGLVEVSSGGMLQNAVVEQGHKSYSIVVSQGGYANNVLVKNGGALTLSGGLASDVVLSGGTEIDQSDLYLRGGSVCNVSAYISGLINISSGIAEKVKVLSGGKLILHSSGAIAKDTTILAGASARAYDGTTLDGLIISSGAQFDIATHNVNASNIYIHNGGTLDVDLDLNSRKISGSHEVYGTFYLNNSVASNFVVGQKDEFKVFGGSALKTTVTSGASMSIRSGALASGTTINSGASVYISRGGIASNTTMAGRLAVDGIARGVTVLSGGSIDGRADAALSNTTISSGGRAYLGGGGGTSAYNMIVKSGGYLEVDGSGGGNAQNAQFYGDQTFGGTVKIVRSDCKMDMQGKTITFAIEERKAADAAIVNNLGYFTNAKYSVRVASNQADGEYKLAQGAENFTGSITIGDGTVNYGNITVSGKGLINGICRYSLSCESGSLILKVGSLSVVDEDTTISSGIAANDLTITSGGNMTVSSGGIAASTLISSGGSMAVADGGSASYTTVTSGGNMYISSGAVHFGGLQIQSGAVVSVNEGGVIDFTLTSRSVDDDWLINDLSGISGTPSYTVTVAADQEWGEYKLAQGVENFNGSISVGDGVVNFGSLAVNGESLEYNGSDFALFRNNGDLILSISESLIDDSWVSVVTELKWQAKNGVDRYFVELSKDNFETVLPISVSHNQLDALASSSGNWQWRVRTARGITWLNGEKITELRDFSTPQRLQSNADGNTDLFFASVNGRWDKFYAAEHQGIINGWQGTEEQVMLSGKNKIADVFSGSDDANIMVMTDDTNGDALFVDDIYTALPGTVAEQQARIAQIDEIRAGAGDDIVDMTSQRFAYAGNGVKIYGGLGNDTIWANNGSNTLFGDAGNDRIVGGENNDVIVGGIGNDSMHGGGGEDIFCFGRNWGNDTVEQLAGGKVTLWFEDGSESNWDASHLTYTDGTNSVKVTGIASDKISLKFGGDTSDLPDGAFAEAASEKIFEDKNKGMLA